MKLGEIRLYKISETYKSIQHQEYHIDITNMNFSSWEMKVTFVIRIIFPIKSILEDGPYSKCGLLSYTK